MIINQKHTPTAEEIRQACWRIQETWSEAERLRRCAWAIEAASVSLPEARDLEITLEFVDKATY